MQLPPTTDLVPPAGGVLLAAGFDWLEPLLPFAFVAIWLLSQVFAVLRRLQGNGGNDRRPPVPRFDPGRQRPRPPPPAGGAGGDDPRTVLEKQIADFLREATGEPRPRAPRPAETAAPGSRRPPVPQRPQQPLREEVTRRRADRQATGPTLAAKERQAGGTDPAARRPAEQEVSVARHVQDVFSRELSHLRGAIKEGEPQGGVAVPAAALAGRAQTDELVHLLRSPATIRQVILLREVLDRPVHRW